MTTTTCSCASACSTTTRRAVVAGGGAAAAALLAACSGGAADVTGDGSPAATAGAEPGSAGASDGSAAPRAGGATIATLDEVPVGGGLIVPDAGVVLVQPEAGTVAAFEVTCPHAGCAVNDISDDAIRCPCHGSAFSLEDGSVVNGPATTGLTAVDVTVEGQDIVLA